MYNELIEISHNLKRSNGADYELCHLLLDQYQYGHFNTVFDNEVKNYINRMIVKYNFPIKKID